MIITIKECIVPGCEKADHRWEFERPTVREVKRMQEVAGLDVSAFEDGMNAVLDGESVVAALDMLLALVDILHRRNGIKVPFEDIDLDFPSLGFDADDEPEGADQSAGEDGDEGKGPDPAPTSHPHAETAVPAGEAASGRVAEEESQPRPSNTQTDSGGGSASP